MATNCRLNVADSPYRLYFIICISFAASYLTKLPLLAPLSSNGTLPDDRLGPSDSGV